MFNTTDATLMWLLETPRPTARQPAMPVNGDDNDLMQTMSEVLKHGPPIAAAVPLPRMVDPLVAGSPTLLDEEKLWRLYTKSGDLLPNGERVRNYLWRIECRRRHRAFPQKRCSSCADFLAREEYLCV
ncbi:hypothetical protein H4S03_002404 [Coemansia sp. S3946]|nr:hypothetical protein H4S03_002404 [Coemansia sp. S3946]